MIMETTTIILSIITTLLGGANIFQLLTFRAYKRKQTAEADSNEIDNLNKIIESQEREIQRLNEKLISFETKLSDLERRMCYATNCEKRIN